MNLNIKKKKYLVGITVIDILGTKGVWKSNPFKFISDVTFLFTEYKKSVDSLRSSLLESLKIVNKDIEIIMDFKTFSDTCLLFLESIRNQ